MPVRFPASRTWATAGLWVCVFVIAVLPILAFACYLVRDLGQEDFAAWSSAPGDFRSWGLLWKSFLLAVGASVGAALLGGPAGCALGYVRVPATRTLCGLLAFPVVTPPYVLAIAWIDILGLNGPVAHAVQRLSGGAVGWPGPYNIFGVCVVLTLAYFPIVTFFVLAAFHRFDSRLEEAGTLSGQGRQVFISIVLPLIAPAFCTGVLFVFVLALLNYAVPSLFQVNTYPVEIYASCATLDYAAAAMQSVPLVALCLAALGIWSLFLRRRTAWLSGRQRNTRLPRNATLRFAASAYCWLLVALCVALPVTVLALRSLPLSTYAEVWRTTRGEFGVTLLVATVSATILTALASSVSILMRSRRSRLLVQGVSLLPFGLAGPLLGLSLIALWNHPGVAGMVYDSLAIVVLALSARFLFFANTAMIMGYQRLDRRLEEAAHIAGLSWWHTVVSVVLPLQLPYMVVCWGCAFVLCVGELDSTVLVCPPGDTTLAIRMFTLMHYGPDAYVATLSLLTTAIIVLVSALTAVGYTVLRTAYNVRD